MGILFIFTLLNCLFLFLAFIRNYQVVEEKIPEWYLIAHSVQILLYVLYFAFRQYIFCSKENSFYLFFILHDIFLIALMLFIANMEAYLYISLTMFFYIIFFTLILGKNMQCEKEEILERNTLPVRSSLPRKTFVEMTEFMNE